MKAAVIFPGPAMSIGGFTPPGDYHLTLASWILRDPHYRRGYQGRGYVIVDNDAHEQGQGGWSEALLAAAAAVGASALVLPDVLFDWELTVARTKASLYLLRPVLEKQLVDLEIMVVPQGVDWDDWRRCLDGLLEAVPPSLFPRLVIGISKDYDVWFENGLVPLIEWVSQIPRPMHLLGWGSKMHLLPLYNKVGGQWVRGIDSAKPVVYALHGIALPDPEALDQAPPYPKRPQGFFTRHDLWLKPDLEGLVWRNIRVFQKAAGATTVP